MQTIDPVLLELAELQINDAQEKRAFVPAGGGDPAAAGGMPPGGDPAAAAAGMPMDPSMGGMPPADPAAAAATTSGGGAPPFDPAALMPLIQQAVQQAMGGGAPGAAGQNPVAGPGGKAKIDPGMIYMELGRCRKLLTTLFEHMQWPLPPDILDDQAVAMTAAGQQPQTAPLGGDQAGGAAAAPGGGLPAMPGSPAVNPIQPPGGAGGGGQKTAETVQDIFANHTLAEAARALDMILG